MKKLRWIAGLMAIMSLIVLAGCAETAQPIETTEDGKMIISWMSGNFAGGAQEGTYPEKLLEETFDVEIKPTFVAITGSFNESKNMMFASGEMTDIIYEYEPAFVKGDVDQGLLAEIPYETIKKYAPTVYENICKQAPITWIYGRVDGKNYGIPNLDYSAAYSRFGLIRTDWLDKLGLEQPTTISELHDVLYAFTFNDPDGNGSKDTWGMSGNSKTYDGFFEDIFGAYGVLPFNWIEVDGKAAYGGLQEGTVEGIRLLAQWYEEGLIHPDFITDDRNTLGEKLTNGVTGFLNHSFGYQNPLNSASLINLTKAITGGTVEYISPVCHDETGVKGTFSWGAPAHTIAFAKHIEEQPEKLQKILEILEAYSKDAKLCEQLRFGEQGNHWDYIDADKGFKGGIKFLAPYEAASAQKQNALMDNFDNPGFFTPATPPYEMWIDHVDEDMYNVLETYGSKEFAMYDMFGKPDVLPAAEKYLADIRAKQIVLMTKAIKGEITPEEYLSQFTDIWNQHGGTEMMEDASQMQDTISQMYSEIGIAE